MIKARVTAWRANHLSRPRRPQPEHRGTLTLPTATARAPAWFGLDPVSSTTTSSAVSISAVAVSVVVSVSVAADDDAAPRDTSPREGNANLVNNRQ